MPTWILKLSRRSRLSAGRPVDSRWCSLTLGSCRPTTRSVPQRRMTGPLLGCALFGDQLVGNVQRLLFATGTADVKTVFAVDDQGRYALHAVFLGECLVLGHLALHGERVERLKELGFIDALSGDEIGHVVRLEQALAFFLDGVEHSSVHLVLYTHGVQGDEELAMGIPWATEQGRDTNEIYIHRQFVDPRINDRLKSIAMRATVPEQLHHFDLARHGNRYRRLQLNIGFTGFKRHIIGSLCGHAEKAGSDESGAEDQITHALLLDK